MSEIRYIKAPFDPDVARSLRAGESVRVSGVILAARDAAHKRMVACLDAGEKLPLDLHGHVVYYVGPSPAKPGYPIGSAGPTTSGRMDAYTPRLLEQGLLGMIGKGYRSAAVVEAMKKHGVPYMAAVGGAGALIARSIKKYTVLAWPELGPEALALMEVENFPAIVVIDSLGNNQYEAGQAPYKTL
ncbi:MAG: Fe-S-containing hydro-lyase [Desulfovibrionaceae bacterium]|nr:Fe-S-containing hydro-lyase [Desulfovibrionaceae bacterium]